MGNLKQQGCRLMVNLALEKAEWVRQVEAAARLAQEGWADCTDMTDEQFDAFMGGRAQQEI